MTRTTTEHMEVMPPFNESRNKAPAPTMLCEKCGKEIPWDEYTNNFGVCDDCMNGWLQEDMLLGPGPDNPPKPKYTCELCGKEVPDLDWLSNRGLCQDCMNKERHHE